MVAVKRTVWWDVTPCSMVRILHLGGRILVFRGFMLSSWLTDSNILSRNLPPTFLWPRRQLFMNSLAKESISMDTLIVEGKNDGILQNFKNQ
jgi:hypothetical protein